jgi:hypothetical protein
VHLGRAGNARELFRERPVVGTQVDERPCWLEQTLDVREVLIVRRVEPRAGPPAECLRGSEGAERDLKPPSSASRAS